MLTVTGVAADSATVTVTATNSADSASQEVMVTVIHVPLQVAEPIEPISVFVDDIAQVDLAGAFLGTVQVYSAMSSSEELATVSVDGTMLTVAGVAAGPATVTVTATNSTESASQEVMVTVMDVPPEVAEPLEPVSVRAGETAMVDLSSAFSGTALVHLAMSSSEELATVSVDGTMVTVTGVAAGPATVTVTATNSADSASQEVMVTVMDVPPAAAKPLEPVSVRAGETAMVDLSNAFSGTALVHSAMSSSEELATVSVDGTMLTVTGVAAGSATVTVTATNSADSASQKVMVTVIHVPLQVAEPIEPISVFVDDIAQVDLAGAFLGTVQVYSAMSSSEGLATVSVDGTMLTVAGVAAGPATVTVTADEQHGKRVAGSHGHGDGCATGSGRAARAGVGSRRRDGHGRSLQRVLRNGTGALGDVLVRRAGHGFGRRHDGDGDRCGRGSGDGDGDGDEQRSQRVRRISP